MNTSSALVAICIVVLCSCRDAAKVSTKDSHDEPVKPQAQAYKPSCTSKSDQWLDAPLRHEPWADKIQVIKLKNAAAQMNRSIAKLPQNVRDELLEQNDRVNSAEGGVSSAAATVRLSCQKFTKAYERFVRASAASAVTQKSPAPVSGPIMDIIECWSFETDRVVTSRQIAAEMQSLGKLKPTSDPELDASLKALFLGWHELDRAVKEERTKAEEFAQTSARMSDVVSKAVRAVAVSEPHSSVLRTGFAVLPNVDVVLQQLELLSDRQSAGTATPLGSTDIMCWSMRLLEPLVRADAAPPDPRNLFSDWEQRRDAIHDMLDQALAVPGTEH